MNDPLPNRPSETKGNTKIKHLVRGSLLLIFAAWMSAGSIRIVFHQLRARTFVAWYAGDTVLRLAVAIFCVWFGARALRHATEEVSPTKVGWGRFLLGTSFLYAGVRGKFFPTPGSIPADDAMGRTITMTFFMAGAVLIAFAFEKFGQKSPPVLSRPKPSTNEIPPTTVVR
jgi:hypothetical protein